MLKEEAGSIAPDRYDRVKVALYLSLKIIYILRYSNSIYHVTDTRDVAMSPYVMVYRKKSRDLA